MRKSFNWSLLDRNMLTSMFISAGRKVVGKELPVTEIHKILAQHLKTYLPINVVKQYGANQQRGLIYIGGLYYASSDEEGTRQISIVLSYHPEDAEIKITNYYWRKMCSLFADTILHEVIHMRQYRARKFKTIEGYESSAHSARQRNSQGYYGHPDEIGAFSFNIACELHHRFDGNIDVIAEYINSGLPKKHKNSTYTRFLMTFNWDHNHKVIRQLKRKILQQLPNAAVGKPFKNANYLTY